MTFQRGTAVRFRKSCLPALSLTELHRGFNLFSGRHIVVVGDRGVVLDTESHAVEVLHASGSIVWAWDSALQEGDE